jgi:elongation factor Ts
MADISAERVKELRERTGAGFMDCKKALTEADGDMDKAVVLLRERGLAAAAKKSARDAREGLVSSYIHTGGRVGVLIEVNCETDFVARTDDFGRLCRDLAMQVAAAGAEFVRREEVAAERVEKEKEIFAAQLANEGKPANIIDKILGGKLDKFYSEVCLLEQPFIKDDKKSVGDLVKETSAKTGENIVVRRFSRFRLGAE